MVYTLQIPAYQWSNKVPAAVWFHYLEREIAAFEDLNCKEFLK